MIVAELPKTRSGKIMRRLLKDVAEHREVGDVTTLADSTVMDLIKSQESDSSEDTATSGETVSLDSCTPESLETLEPGKLTVATDKPAFPPYFVDDDPTNGEGFESAVAYAIAGKLGFSEPAAFSRASESCAIFCFAPADRMFALSTTRPVR